MALTCAPRARPPPPPPPPSSASGPCPQGHTQTSPPAHAPSMAYQSQAIHRLWSLREGHLACKEGQEACVRTPGLLTSACFLRHRGGRGFEAPTVSCRVFLPYLKLASPVITNTNLHSNIIKKYEKKLWEVIPLQMPPLGPAPEARKGKRQCATVSLCDCVSAPVPRCHCAGLTSQLLGLGGQRRHCLHSNIHSA